VYVYSVSWAIAKIPKDKIGKFLYFVAPFLMVFVNTLATLDTLPKFKKSVVEPVENLEEGAQVVVEKNTKANFYFVNALVTILVLCIIIPLLSYSNPYFGQIVDKILANFYNTFRDIFSFASIIRLFLAVLLYNFLPRLYCYLNIQEPVIASDESQQEFDLSIPKVAVISTIFAFFVAQVQIYFNPSLLANNTGKTVNEIFFHLSVVCLIVFALLCISLKAKILVKITSWILLFQATLLGLIALNSDWAYISNWGLTHKRLYGLAIIIWIFGAIIIFGYKSLRISNLTKSLVLLVAIVFGLTNLANLDYLVYQNPPQEATGIEKNYISAMSLDSGSLEIEYKKQLAIVELAQKEGGFNNDCYEPSWFYSNTNQIHYLQEKYSKTQILSWNWSEYTNYQKVKNIKLVDANNLYSQSSDYSQNGYKNCYQRIFSSWEN
jgi:hypothetical protein